MGSNLVKCVTNKKQDLDIENYWQLLDGVQSFLLQSWYGNMVILIKMLQQLPLIKSEAKGTLSSSKGFEN